MRNARELAIDFTVDLSYFLEEDKEEEFRVKLERRLKEIKNTIEKPETFQLDREMPDFEARIKQAEKEAGIQ